MIGSIACAAARRALLKLRKSPIARYSKRRAVAAERLLARRHAGDELPVDAAALHAAAHRAFAAHAPLAVLAVVAAQVAAAGEAVLLEGGLAVVELAALR